MAVNVAILYRAVNDSKVFGQRPKGVSSQKQEHKQCLKVACSRNTQASVYKRMSQAKTGRRRWGLRGGGADNVGTSDFTLRWEAMD